MIKLVPAKCPSCGAQLELDDNMKKAKCDFCKNTVIVDDAIAKYKFEISGNVKVSGIKDYSDKLLTVKKHLKAGKYINAKDSLEKILEDDEYNLEALKEYVNLLLDHRHEFVEFIASDVEYLSILEDKIHMLESVDDAGEYKDLIKKTKEKTEVISKDINNRKHKEQINALYSVCNIYINLDKSNKKKRIFELQQHFEIDDITIDSLSTKVNNNEKCEIKYVEGLIANYRKTTKKVKEKANNLQTIVTIVLSAIILFLEWQYIISDIIDSFSHFSILTPIAAVIYIIIGIGVSLLVIGISQFIAFLIAKLFIKK